MRVLIAVGMVGATEEEWTDYQRMFARSVRHINYPLVRGYDGEYTSHVQIIKYSHQRLIQPQIHEDLQSN